MEGTLTEDLRRDGESAQIDLSPYFKPADEERGRLMMQSMTGDVRAACERHLLELIDKVEESYTSLNTIPRFDETRSFTDAELTTILFNFCVNDEKLRTALAFCNKALTDDPLCTKEMALKRYLMDFFC